MNYVGHRISKAIIAIDPDKVAVVRNWDKPNSLKELRRFPVVCLISLLVCVCGFTQVAEPLNELIVQLAGREKLEMHW